MRTGEMKDAAMAAVTGRPRFWRW